MKPTLSIRRPASLLATSCLGLCAALVAATAYAASPASADPLPSYKMKSGPMICGSHLRMDVKAEGRDDHAILLTWKGRHYLMLRKPTTTGAYHFDDRKAGLVMIQIPAKSMLFDNRNMTRLADDCNPMVATPIVATK